MSWGACIMANQPRKVQGDSEAGIPFPKWAMVVSLAPTVFILAVFLYAVVDISAFQKSTVTPKVVAGLFDLVFSNWEYDRDNLRPFLRENFVLGTEVNYKEIQQEFLSVREDNVRYATPGYRILHQLNGCCIVEPLLVDGDGASPRFMLVYSLDTDGRITDYTFGILKDVEKEAGAEASALVGGGG